LQSLWGMINTLSLISFTSLFDMKTTPGNVYIVEKLMIQFYTFRYQVFGSNFVGLSDKLPHNRNWEEMSMKSTNFFTLESMLTLLLCIFAFLTAFFGVFRYLSVRNYMNPSWRNIGVRLPTSRLFSRMFIRIFIVCSLELFISCYVAVVHITSLENEFD
jgi:hypothetical protein